MNQKKITYKDIIFIIIISIGWIFGGRILLQEFFSLDAVVRSFISILGLSIMGVILFILKRHPDANPHFIDSMEMLIIGIGPTVASFELLPKDDFGRIFMPVITALITVFWFVYFGFFIKPREYSEPDKIEREKRFIKQSKGVTLVLFCGLIVLELVLFSGMLEINRIMDHVSNLQ